VIQITTEHQSFRKLRSTSDIASSDASPAAVPSVQGRPMPSLHARAIPRAADATTPIAATSPRMPRSQRSSMGIEWAHGIPPTGVSQPRVAASGREASLISKKTHGPFPSHG